MSATANYKLFTPLKIGKDLELKNRVIFGPLTRARSDKVTRVPTEINEIYYEQRAGAGLVITEATAISEQSFGWYGAPGLYNKEHVEGWKRVTNRVHAKGGKIFVQLWHMGRQGHSSFNPKNEIVSASAIGITQGRLRNAQGEHVEYEVPRALETHEVEAIVEDFRKSTALAKEAGFDGVELHAANGYLIDQFLQAGTNKRTDKYGGSWENRVRFLLEIIEAVKTVWPSGRIGVRLAPNGAFAQMGHEENHEFFTYVVEQLSKHDLGYLAILDGFGFGYHNKCPIFTAFDAKKAFKGTVIANNSYTRDIAEGAVRSGAADAVGFGRAYISNPDLAERFQNDWPLNPDAEYDDFWNSDKGAQGYITFPAYTAPEVTN